MSADGRETRPKRGRRRLFWALGMLCVLAIGVVGAGFALTGRTLDAPQWITTRVETRMNQALGANPDVGIALGGLSLSVSGSGVPRVAMTDLQILDDHGRVLAHVDRARARLGAKALLSGQLELRRMQLSGATLAVERDADGRLNISFGGSPEAEITPDPDAAEPASLLASGSAAAGAMSDIFDAVDRAFDDPILSQLEAVEADELSLSFDDARVGRRMEASGGRLSLVQEPSKISLRLSFALAADGGAPAETTITVETDRSSSAARFGASVSGVPAADVAAQSPAFAFLSLLDAPLSGSFRAVVDASGRIDTIDGAMQVSEGNLRPSEGAPPIPFNAGRTYFSYDAERGRIDFNEVFVETEAASMAAEGWAYLEKAEDGWPDTILGQFQFENVHVNPHEALSEPAEFNGGAADLRLTLRPFSLTIGQIVLTRGERRFLLRGEIGADLQGWSSSLDGSLNEIEHDRLLALWPLELAPKTRDWVARNLQAGLLSNVSGAMRTNAEGARWMSVGYNFEGAELRFLPAMPPIRGGTGRATITGESYTMVLDAGEVMSSQNGPVDVSGTVVRIPDMRARPARLEVDLQAKGELIAVLDLLDRPPFELLSKAGRDTDLAEGRIEATASIGFELGRDLSPDQVAFSVDAKLQDLRSSQIVEGRMLRADEMRLTATPDLLEIGGPGTLDGVPFNVTWSRALGQGPQTGSRIEGNIELSDRFAEAFGLGLPPGTLSGTGQGVITVDLAPDAPPSFRLRSDLAQLGMRLDAVGWSKPAARAGTLDVEGVLGPQPAISRLELQAAGLSAVGRVSLTPQGGLDEARFERVQIGDWFDAPVTFSGRGQGAAPAITLSGGMLDLRRAAFGGGGEGGGRPPVTVRLNRLVISDSILLTGVEGTLTGERFLSGRFTGMVNGAAPVSATLAPAQNGGTAVRVLSDDAGDVLRAAGLFQGARRGTLDLTLTPLGPKGYYDGTLNIKAIRVRDAPTLAELVSAISVVGLLEQLDGDGLVFSDAMAKFRLTPERVIVTESSAVGNSLGISMDGFYDLARQTIDVQGVVSPIYMLNAVGSIFTRNREGLFGFNFTMKGKVGDARVSVNPLSILTPGMFREIFRRPPPQLAQ